MLSMHGPLYPELLKQIPDPPLILFVRGPIEPLLENMNCCRNRNERHHSDRRKGRYTSCEVARRASLVHRQRIG